MNLGQTALLLADARHEHDRQRADGSRRERDASATERTTAATPAPGRTFAAILRLIPRHA